MSESIGTAVLDLDVDDSALQTGLTESTSTAQKGITNLRNVVLGVGTGAAVAVAAVGKAAFDVSAQTAEAAKMLQAQLDVTEERGLELAEISKDVWANNFAGSVTEAAEAVKLVSQQFDGIAGQEQKFTELAFQISDAFGQPIEDVIAAASTLDAEFADLSTSDAFDIIAAGFQKGLDKSGDFLDSVGEYSNLFSDAGFSAAEMFSTMETGMAGGVLGTDKISDALKEFNILLMEGSDDAADALAAIGVNTEEVFAGLRDGSVTVKDVFDETIAKLNEIEDPIERNIQATELFGTMAEDLGPSFTEGLSTSITELESMQGSAEELAVVYDNMGDSLGGVWRTILDEISPLTDKIVELINDWLPKFTTWLDTNSPAIKQWFVDTWEAIKPFAEGFAEGTETIYTWIVAFWDWLSENKPLMIAAFTAIGAIIVTALGPLAASALAIAALITAVGLIKENWDTIEQYFKDIWENINQKFTDGWNSLTENVLNPFYAAAAALTTGWGVIEGWFVTMWNNIGQVFTDTWAAITALLFPDPDYATQLKEAWANIANAIKNVFIDGANAAIDVLNSLVALMNTALKKWNDLSFGVGPFSETVGWGKFSKTFSWAGITLNTPNVDLIPNLAKFPKVELAEGGIVMPEVGGTIARLAEGGVPEAVIPLNDSRAAGMLGGAGGSTVILQAENVYGWDHLEDLLGQAGVNIQISGARNTFQGA